MGKRGPKAGGNYSRAGANLSARLTEETIEKLKAAADTNQRSVSRELEFRLKRGFAADETFGPANTRALLRLIFEITKSAREMTGQGWRENAFTYNLAVAAIQLVFQALTPAGSPEPPATFPTYAPWQHSAAVRGFRTGGQSFVRAFAGPLAQTIISRLLDAGGGRDEFASWVGQQAADIGRMHERASPAEGMPGEAGADERRLYRAIADALGTVAQKAVVTERPKKQRRKP